MTERLDWIEKASIENMKAHHTCADIIAKDAALTLALLLAGMGAGLAYAAKAVDVHSWNWFSVGATVFTLWLLAVSWFLVEKCLMLADLPQIYNTPENLDLPEFTFDELREAELRGLQVRITQAGLRNGKLADHLNLARRLAIASPAVFIFSAVVWWVGTQVFGVA